LKSFSDSPIDSGLGRVAPGTGLLSGGTVELLADKRRKMQAAQSGCVSVVANGALQSTHVRLSLMDCQSVIHN